MEMVSTDYDAVKDTVVAIMESHAQINMNDLTRLAYNELNGKLKGNLVAFIKAVQNDLETKGVLERSYRSGQHFVIWAK